MTLRKFMHGLSETGDLVHIQQPVDPYLEMAPIIAALDGRPVLFSSVVGSQFRVLTGLCSDRRYFAMALDCPVEELIFRMANALAAPQPAPLVERAEAPC